MNSTQGLRFAPLIRVSTEDQERRGESLKTQKKRIERAVEAMEGTIPYNCWQYCGQEHATENFERQKFNSLLEDAQQFDYNFEPERPKHFDAVIVDDFSRWSRDQSESLRGLNILQKNGIRFFILGMEYDLNSPEQRYMLSISGSTSQFFADLQAYKSLVNRIHRAKRNMPAAGKLPFGRTWDKKKEQWGVDNKLKANVQWAAKQYLEGESLNKIAKKLNMNHPNMVKILRLRCGDKWTMNFKNDRFNIDETVTITIPRLLSEKTIKKIHQMLEANRTYFHGQLKHKYLLGRMIFCAECGYAMSGQANRYGKLYYRHPRDRGCKVINSIPADVIDEPIMRHVFELFGDKAKLEQAAKDAIPNKDEMKRLKERMKENKKEIKKIASAKEKILDMVESGGFDKDDVTMRMKKHREREDLLRSENVQIKNRLAVLPTEEQISMKAQLMQRVMESFHRSPARYEELTFEDKRKILQTIFAGKDTEGKRYGVYIKMVKDGWLYTLKGVFGEPVGRLKNDKKLDMVSKRNAHHSFCLYQ